MIAQRLGESDAEYEARKRRVKLQRNVSSDMFAHRGGGGGRVIYSSSGHCITQGTDGTNYGIKRSLPTAFGSIDPESTPEGILIYDFYCQPSGEVVMRLGDDGGYEVPGILALRIYYGNGGELDMLWVGLENMYVADDNDFTDYAVSIPVDSEYCVSVARVPANMPQAPTDFRILTSDDLTITFAWTASVEGTYPIAHYNLQVDEVTVATPTGTGYVHDVTPNIEYKYRIQAQDDRGNVGAWSDTITYTNVVP